MNLIRRAAPLAAAALTASMVLAPLAQAAQHSATSTPTVIATKVNAYFAGLAQAKQFSGAVLLAQGNTILLSKGYGMADWAHQISNTSSTVFLAPSLLVEFAPVAILQLMDAGKVHDGDRLCTYIPHCPATWAPITLHEVLNGDTGLHDYIRANSSLWGQSFSLKQDLALIESEPLDFAPGTRGKESTNPSIPIEEYLVEKVTGQSYATYVRQHFILPLGLTHTGYFLHVPNLTSSHVVGYQKWQVPVSPNVNQSDESIDGGDVYTTLTEYFRWEQAVLTGHLLSPTAQARFTTLSNPQPCGGYLPCGGGITGVGTSEGTLVWLANHQQLVGMVTEDGICEALDSYAPRSNQLLIVLMNYIDTPENPFPTMFTLISG